MKKYSSAHIIMLIVFIAMQSGIVLNYWPNIGEKNWSIHIHYWTATLWYILLITQPYLATRGNIDKHRTYGMIGLFIAGGVVFTALSPLTKTIRDAEFLLNFEGPPPFPPNFLFGTIIAEIIMMIAFTVALILAIIKRKDLENHAWWMLSTGFYVMMPALSRGIGKFYGFLSMQVTWQHSVTAMALIIIGTLLVAWKFEKLRHPATWLIIVVNLTAPFILPIGNIKAVQEFLMDFIVY